MAPSKSIPGVFQDSHALPSAVKNTFLNFGDRDDCTMRRLVSEPAPKRHISEAQQKLGSFQEEPGGEFSDEDFDVAESSGFLRQLPLDVQISDLATAEAQMKRQISSLSMEAENLQRQLSSLSTQGFDLDESMCRQETEQVWPTYSQTIPGGSKANFTQEAFVAEPEPEEPEEPEQESSNEERSKEVLPLMQLVPMPSVGFDAAVAPPMCNMVWPGMMPMMPTPAMDPYFGMPRPWTGSQEPQVPPFRNRRKARSLITQAQESQKKQESVAWASKVQLLRKRFEQQQQLQQQVGQSTKLEVTPEAQDDAAQGEVLKSGLTKPELLPNGEAPAPSKKEEKSDAAFCPYCGGKVAQRFKFCRYCGNDVAQLWGL